jgi:hypothetical protein
MVQRYMQDVFVSLISIFNCAGRMFWGIVSDYFLMNWGIPRPYFFGIVSGILCGVHLLLLAVDDIWVLYVASVLGAHRVSSLSCYCDVFGGTLCCAFICHLPRSCVLMLCLFNFGTAASSQGAHPVSLSTQTD